MSSYLTAPAAAILDKYAGERERLLPSTANQVMNRYGISSDETIDLMAVVPSGATGRASALLL